MGDSGPSIGPLPQNPLQCYLWIQGTVAHFTYSQSYRGLFDTFSILSSHSIHDQILFRKTHNFFMIFISSSRVYSNINVPHLHQNGNLKNDIKKNIYTKKKLKPKLDIFISTSLRLNFLHLLKKILPF